MTVEKTFQGAWRISAIVAGRFISRQYFFYTKSEAIAEFKQELKAGYPAFSFVHCPR